MRIKSSIGGRLLLAGAIGAATLLTTVAGASASTTTSNWKLGYYNTSGRSLSMSSVSGVSPALATFNFTNQDNTALLVTTQGSNKNALLGDDRTKTIIATYTISGVTEPTATTFNYFGEPDGSGGTANVRLYFETGGKFAYTNFWWSDSASQVLANGTYTLTATIDPTLAWGDWNGQPSATNTTAFQNAASNVTLIGLSFGGGYFFENGVGTTDGSGTFTLNSVTS